MNSAIRPATYTRRRQEYPSRHGDARSLRASSGALRPRPGPPALCPPAAEPRASFKRIRPVARPARLGLGIKAINQPSGNSAASAGRERTSSRRSGKSWILLRRTCGSKRSFGARHRLKSPKSAQWPAQLDWRLVAKARRSIAARGVRHAFSPPHRYRTGLSAIKPSLLPTQHGDWILATTDWRPKMARLS